MKGNKKKKLTAKKQREQDIKQEREAVCREISNHAQTLAEEMNVRIFLHTETGRMLFVERVTVADIHFPDNRKNIFVKIGTWLGQTWKQFRRLFSR